MIDKTHLLILAAVFSANAIADDSNARINLVKFSITAKIHNISDGDTIKLIKHNKFFKIRLSDIPTPGIENAKSDWLKQDTIDLLVERSKKILISV